MPDPADPAPETEAKKSRGLGSYVVWGFVVVMVYLLSFGPMLKLAENGIGSRILQIVYSPVEWAYLHTPFHKPLGMYLHLWCPKLFDKSGEVPPESVYVMPIKSDSEH